MSVFLWGWNTTVSKQTAQKLNLDDRAMAERAAQEIIAIEGSGVLWILDGWDLLSACVFLLMVDQFITILSTSLFKRCWLPSIYLKCLQLIRSKHLTPCSMRLGLVPSSSFLQPSPSFVH